jgi:hypothetical protein
MTTIEKGITTTAQLEDLKLVKATIVGFEYYDGYYGRLCKIKLELKYKEFTTLADDLNMFYNKTEAQLGKFSVKEIASLKRSLIMLRERYLLNVDNKNQVYLNFLNDSISNFDKWIDEVIEAICENIEFV